MFPYIQKKKKKKISGHSKWDADSEIYLWCIQNLTLCFVNNIAILTTRRKHMLSPQQNNARIQKHEFFSLIGVIINNGKFGNFTHFLITNLQQSSVLPLIGDWLMRAARKFTFYNIKSGIWLSGQPPRLRGRNMHWWGEGLSPRSIRTLISKLHR